MDREIGIRFFSDEEAKRIMESRSKGVMPGLKPIVKKIDIEHNGVKMSGSALFSPCEIYRYRLKRVWDESLPSVAFLMLNPSTATEEVFDPTVRRCWGYAKDWGYGSLEVVNIFSLRATNPKGLRQIEDPIGPYNNQAIIECRKEVDIMVAAWGTHGKFMNRGREVLEILQPYGGLHYLELSKDGIPKHPLYLKAELKPQVLEF